MKTSKHFMVILSAILFAFLFYKKGLGINVGIYGLFTAMALLISNRGKANSLLNSLLLGGLAISTLAFSYHGGTLSLTMAFTSLFLIYGVQTIKPMRNLVNAIPNSVVLYFKSWGDLFDSFAQNTGVKKGRGAIGRYLRIAIIPLVILIAFIYLYSVGSSSFGKYFTDFFEWVGRNLGSLLQNINLTLIFIMLFGIALGVVHALSPSTTVFSIKDERETDHLLRDRTKAKRYFGILDLKDEYRSGVFLFAGLIILITGLLAIEIGTNWFNFEWTGEMLKPMVHEGTYALIISIVVSICITAYFFRKNLNFYKGNKLLLILAKIWIILNVILVVSVGVRNYHYIYHFALAYKRIGVYFFLLLCIVGLVTLWFKVNQRRSLSYLIRLNSLAAYIGLIGLTVFNWDVIIAKYNIAHADRSFLHLPFLKELDDSALPILKLSDEEIQDIEKKQLEAIPFAQNGYFELTHYKYHIDFRIGKFNSKFESKSVLERNFAEMEAYNKLNSNIRK